MDDTEDSSSSAETPLVRRGNHYYINNTLEGGNAAIDFTFGREGDEVYAGTWR